MYDVSGSMTSKKNRHTEQKKYFPCSAHKGVFRKFKIAYPKPDPKTNRNGT